MLRVSSFIVSALLGIVILKSKVPLKDLFNVDVFQDSITHKITFSREHALDHSCFPKIVICPLRGMNSCHDTKFNLRQTLKNKQHRVALFLSVEILHLNKDLPFSK